MRCRELTKPIAPANNIGEDVCESLAAIRHLGVLSQKLREQRSTLNASRISRRWMARFHHSHAQ